MVTYRWPRGMPVPVLVLVRLLVVVVGGVPARPEKGLTIRRRRRFACSAVVTAALDLLLAVSSRASWTRSLDLLAPCYRPPAAPAATTPPTKREPLQLPQSQPLRAVRPRAELRGSREQR
uniref:Putative secreted protein n=1 Tax=Anopheles darlingi TaxID=43151 RepID=A0A2M4DHA3_ANODA